MIERLGWVSARASRGLDEDEPLGLAALRRRGVDVEVVDWDDPDVSWSGFDRVALRSPWDYTERLAEFTAWLERVDAVTELVNPLATVRWSLDKRYLGELAEAGVPVTPTTFVAPGSAAELPAGGCVVKPAVGAGGRGAASYGADERDAATRHVAELHRQGQVVLVQPLLASVAADGESALVFLDGRLSHAATKRVTLPRGGRVEGLFVAEAVVPHDPSADEAQVAAAAVGWVSDRFGTPAYARVDLVRDDEGRCCVLELELVEPSLFLTTAPPAAADRLAEALTR